ncbi:hypothetical protein [Mycoplasma buteonis]|uniref:hypothetical protein n=1 Tax=Mycoplasma buteonis TaxID=171280 RepID=UPI00055A8F54|nr:hypothetical protein [Mycoplasma buteonis]
MREEKETSTNNLMDLIEFRKQEIQHEILLAKSELIQQNNLRSEQSKKWYQRGVFLNLLGAGVTVVVIIALMLIAYLVSLKL